MAAVDAVGEEVAVADAAANRKANHGPVAELADAGDLKSPEG